MWRWCSSGRQGLWGEEELDVRMDRIRVVKQPPSLSPLSHLFVLDPITTASDLQAHVVW